MAAACSQCACGWCRGNLLCGACQGGEEGRGPALEGAAEGGERAGGGRIDAHHVAQVQEQEAAGRGDSARGRRLSRWLQPREADGVQAVRHRRRLAELGRHLPQPPRDLNHGPEEEVPCTGSAACRHHRAAAFSLGGRRGGGVYCATGYGCHTFWL